MDFTKVINQAIARSVNKCYAEEEAIRLPQTNWAFTPLIPPGCVPFLELYGLENGERKKLRNLSTLRGVSHANYLLDISKLGSFASKFHF